jgi:hypothetical protein
MKALFADLSERTRQRRSDIDADKASERRHELALCETTIHMWRRAWFQCAISSKLT